MEKRRSGYIILILLCLVLVVAAAALSGVGKGGKTAPPTQTAQAAVTPPAVEATPVPTPSATPPVYPDLTEKAAAADDSFSDTVFVGNSLVDGLYLYGGLTGCRWLSGTGVSLYNVAKQTISDKVGGECTVTQGLSAKQYGRVYLELGINEIGMEQVVGPVEHHDDLQDQRRAPQDGDEDAHQPAQRQKAAPPPQTHQQAQRQGEQQCQEKDQQRVAEARHQLGHKVHKTHIGSCKRSKGTRGGKFPAFLKAVIDCDQPLRAAI